MAAVLQVQPQPYKSPSIPPARTSTPEPQFCLLGPRAGGASYGLTLGLSSIAHVALVAAIVLLPLWFVDQLVPPTDAVRAFFVAPPAVTPPPPPPPPPPTMSAVRRSAAVVPTPPARDHALRAPVEVPNELPPDPGIDLGAGFGVEGGVEGGIEGGVVGGVVGGLVGGIVSEPAATPPPVRVGGNIKAPRILHRVAPVYPQLAAQARVRGMVVLEAYVDARGIVREVKVLRGAALLDEAALTAVRQWRYQPLLLNGLATPFVLVVTVNFNLTNAAGQ